ncbi:putative AP-1-like transcription factor [Clavispora lusitaniae]|uniref:AP-1-like transcription factor n=1 Tax=Clavispora lusitaniae TaxID=36911 RepID=A0ACD0WKM9_CLALS|nr:putative AP-1-like transcription factor [Clavispora lusitaniae]QFZ33071.1 putative AP-1-like transcription factor [Clavispora lusitaniae]QFZ38741.1 putative AP-1-like transcription factor [Clavispora lusitaniae]QFZ44423.1 putative AP-1-like transcription factor [Clavispora lusitaniae]QFZ50101.1 putative AP-1-like transcription factor [Clavispora lusitaniae]
MSDTKRSYSEDPESVAAHEDKKPHTKPGRKPIDAEPKSKRTAQNRAAQRAYRERKERKMKDLEERVAHLEDDKIKAASEKDFLRAQIELLKGELSRYKGSSDISELLNLTAKQFSWNQKDSAQKQVKEEPRDKPSTSPEGQLPDLVSGSSSSTSPLDDTLHISTNSSETSASLHQGINPENQFSAGFEEQLDPFCVNLNEACGNKSRPEPKYYRSSDPVPPLSPEELNEQQANKWKYESPFHTLFSPNESVNDPFFNSTGTAFHLPVTDVNDDPLSFLNDNNFDVSLALGPGNDVLPGKNADADPLAGLTTEESMYDPLNSVNTDFNFNEFVKSSLPSDVSSHANSVLDASKPGSSATSVNTFTSPVEKDDLEVVPAPGKQVKCSEIWDRITSHPRYTDIDIDSLCSELKSKAKCSEKGVVLDDKDVDSLIARSAVKQR